MHLAKISMIENALAGPLEKVDQGLDFYVSEDDG